MKKPCTGCQHAVRTDWGGKVEYYPKLECGTGCREYKNYQNYLESRRKYRRGKTIRNVEELIKCCEQNNFVYWRHKILHRGFVYSWQLQMIMNSIQAGVFQEAVRKD